MKFKVLALILFFTTAAFAHDITLSWNPGTGGGAVTGYNVKRSTTAGGPYTTVNSATGSATSYVDASAPLQVEGAKFYYVISATGPGGESPNSVEVSATIPFSVPATPTAPTAVSH